MSISGYLDKPSLTKNDIKPVSAGCQDLRVSAISAGRRESKNRNFLKNRNIIFKNKNKILFLGKNLKSIFKISAARRDRFIYFWTFFCP
jgi:hypothetical protein